MRPEKGYHRLKKNFDKTSSCHSFIQSKNESFFFHFYRQDVSHIPLFIILFLLAKQR